MNETIILEEIFVKMSYLTERKMVQVIWNGTPTKEEYQRVFTIALDFQKAVNVPVHNFLSDIRHQGVVNPESRKWFESYAVPRAAKQGIKRGAVVFDGNIFKKYYVNLILQSTNKFRIPFKFFNKTEDAYEWFDSFED